MIHIYMPVTEYNKLNHERFAQALLNLGGTLGAQVHLTDPLGDEVPFRPVVLPDAVFERVVSILERADTE